ncbi:acetylornithine deacetylase [Zhihengliuella alba]|uniref:Acetylornithine deacetylase n=1 Tax=Zhihengliuella alba TaxID=547018 RepID=A0ABP7DHM9_9MICC
MKHTPDSLAEIERLIRFDTTSRDSNLPLIDHVAGRLRSVGVEPTLVRNAEGTKANLLATFPAADGSTRGGTVVSAHTDVVPVDGQDWSSDPFAPEVRDGRLYARGSADMKSFLGVAVARIGAMAAQPLAEPIHLALSYDEEVGCIGAVSLVDAIVDAGLEPTGCVVGEPTSMRMIRGHKSVNVLQAHFRGVAAHSSLPTEGVNAIAHAAEFVRFVHAVAAEFAQDGPFDDGYLVPYTTTTANRIDGGIAVNTIPADCTVTFEFRSIAAVDQEELIGRFRAEAERIGALMREQDSAAGTDFTIVSTAPGLETPGDAAIVSRVVEWGADESAGKVTYGTEAGLFSRAGIPTVVYGPGDIAQAHAPDEFIELEQIARCESFFDRLIEAHRA